MTVGFCQDMPLHEEYKLFDGLHGLLRCALVHLWWFDVCNATPHGVVATNSTTNALRMLL